MAPMDSKLWLSLLVCVVGVIGVVGYSETPRQYHIQTDEGPDRYFRFQTYNGQFRKEKRFEDGSVVGTYGWVDPLGLLRLYDYIADTLGYRIVRQRTMKVAPIVDPPPQPSPQHFQRRPVTISQKATQSQPVTSVVTQPQPVTEPPAVTRPLHPTRLRPVSPLRPVPKLPQVAVVEPEVETSPFPGPSVVPQPHTLKPILVPLSQTGSLTPSLVQLQPVTLRPQLLVRQTIPNVTPIPLVPISNNNVILGKDFESNGVEATTQGSGSFGDRTEVEKPSNAPAGKTERGGGRFRGKPLALKRRPVAVDPTEEPSSPVNRGSARFKGVPLAAQKGTPKLLQPVPLNQRESSPAPAFGTLSDSHRNSGFDSAVSSTNSDSNNRFLRQPVHRGTDLPARSHGTGTDMWTL
ncbi:gametogenetin-like isoform X2 [Macrobrachium nipponense]|uniref:gametogenetin-like isoform X2 n=1 Tax=Macrobrachium nipponense TaxID=159736 RepID=UPI0030C8B9E7